jgi:phosphoribosylformimino-5-aminoimidazole carboxamide ribotide isomerase
MYSEFPSPRKFRFFAYEDGYLIIIPAIDLRDGKCVRLAQGNFDQMTVYSDDPVDVALRWRSKGAQRIHVVDLDGSRAGEPQNMAVVKDIIAAVDIPVEIGGGIRDMKTLEAYLALGAGWVILGTAALRDESFVRHACRLYGNRVILGIDASDGMVAIQGWIEKTSISAHDLAVRYEDYGLSAIVYTDIKRDGMEKGVNIEATKAFARSIKTPVIASGGVSGIQDIENVIAIEKYGVLGVIAGKSLYTGALLLEDAIALAAEN